MTDHSIHKAAADGDIELVKKLLDEDPALVDLEDEYQWRPLFHAGLYKQAGMVQLLIDRGADLSAHDGYAIHYAAEVPENMPVVSLLIQYGALEAHTRPASQAAREFMHAVYMGNASRVAALIHAAPGLVHELYARGDTALHHACQNGSLEVVRVLVEHGSNVDELSETGHFPLYCAAGHGHREITLFLLRQGANLDQKLPDGKTVIAWLQQYPHDQRFSSVLETISHYRAEGPV